MSLGRSYICVVGLLSFHSSLQVWLVGWVAGWLDGWLIGLSVDWLIGWLFGLSFGISYHSSFFHNNLSFFCNILTKYINSFKDSS
jgi:hypothetical protein